MKVGYVKDWNINIPYSQHPLYNIWRSMIRRCYGNKEKEHEFYLEITVCERWHNFKNFVDDYKKIEGYNNEFEAQQLDKDVKGGKEYSLKNCCLIPKDLNLFLTNKKRNSFYPIGITYSKSRNKYCCQIKHCGKTINLGRYSKNYNGLQLAISKYWSAKLLYLEELRHLTTEEIYCRIKNKLKHDLESELRKVEKYENR